MAAGLAIAGEGGQYNGKDDLVRCFVLYDGFHGRSHFRL